MGVAWARKKGKSMTLSEAFRDYVKSRLEKALLFRGVSQAALQEMLGQFRQTTWRKGVMARPDDLARWFYLVVDGRARVEVVDRDTGKPFTLFLLCPGDGFDVVTLLDGQPHDVTTVAIDDLHLIHAPIGAVRDWIGRHPEFNRNFMPFLAGHMRQMEKLAGDLATSNTATRLSRLILRNTDGKDCKNGTHGVRLIHDLPNEALARMIGSTRQVVNKHLQALRHSNILDPHTKNLLVTDLAALEKRAAAFLGVTSDKS